MDQNSFGIVLALGYGGLHASKRKLKEVIYALGILYNFICRIPGFKIL